jgi:hypothetical protein
MLSWRWRQQVLQKCWRLSLKLSKLLALKTGEADWYRSNKVHGVTSHLSMSHVPKIITVLWSVPQFSSGLFMWSFPTKLHKNIILTLSSWCHNNILSYDEGKIFPALKNHAMKTNGRPRWRWVVKSMLCFTTLHMRLGDLRTGLDVTAKKKIATSAGDQTLCIHVSHL